MTQLPPTSSSSTLAFVLIVAAVSGAFIWAIVATSPNAKRDGVLAAAGIALWLVTTGMLAKSGALDVPGMPPRLALYFLGSNFAACVLAFSPVGTRLAHGVPLFALIGFHAFRLPLELVLHTWASEGAIPVQMTFSGHNFDIVTGVFAIVAAVLVRKRESRSLALVFNIVGTVLLLGVMVIAVLSSPLPVRRYLNDPPLLLASAFPHTWIVSVCVAGALAGHLVLFRRLLGRAR